jgi:UDP-GlcNAc:undecaprenyl-phosphate GlcNAc-1-phosphate transferase
VTAVAAVLAALAAALLLTPFAARMRGFSAAPVTDRWHTRQTPATGGIALCGGLLAGLAVVLALGAGTRTDLVIGVGGTLAFLLGLRDDAHAFAPKVKLLGQIAIGVGGALAGLSPDWAPAWIGVPVAAFVLVAAMNSVNLLDNIDGLSAGTTAVAAAGVIGAGAIAFGAAPLAACALLGAGLGFLPFNFRPGRGALLFMGDSGSHLLGFALGGSVLAFAGTGSFSLLRSLVVPVLLVAVPVLDTSLVMIVRSLEGRALSEGGRDHLSHRLVYCGLGDGAAVLLLVATSATCAAIACGLLEIDSAPLALIVGTSVAAVLGVAAVRLVARGTEAALVPAAARPRAVSANVISTP